MVHYSSVLHELFLLNLFVLVFSSTSSDLFHFLMKLCHFLVKLCGQGRSLEAGSPLIMLSFQFNHMDTSLQQLSKEVFSLNRGLSSDSQATILR